MSEWKKSFIEAEQEKGSEERLRVEPGTSHRIGLYVTVCLFLTGIILILSTILGIVLLEGVWVVVVAGGCVGMSVMVAASVVTWLARGLVNTALMQGYLIIAVLSVASCVLQVTLLVLLSKISPIPPNFPPTSHQETMRAWVQFVGGAQGAMAVLVSGMVGGAIVATSCCCRPPQDNVVGVVGVYHHR
ncbi:hypothetical protein Pmani_005264 [Petrolisthes manimaculis]|uniref:Transmembrane protein n=1 Tax=Petrolisthes manimaculis TaxID=1843537 RepID=A0AAE1UN35_9EUCA|nr:hypothetical protein Pmani_005264 [Petrolisthes manimaculis]